MQLLNTYVQQPKKTVQQLTEPIADGFTVNPLGPLGSLSPLVHQNLQKLPTKPIQQLKHPITADTNVDAAAKKSDTSAKKTDTAAQQKRYSSYQHNYSSYQHNYSNHDTDNELLQRSPQ